MTTPNSTGRQWTERPSAKTSKAGDAEAMFRMMFDRSADAILLLDPRREVLSIAARPPST